MIYLQLLLICGNKMKNKRNFIDIKVDPTTGILCKVTKESVLGVQYIPKLQTAHCFVTRETIINIEPVENA